MYNFWWKDVILEDTHNNLHTSHANYHHVYGTGITFLFFLSRFTSQTFATIKPYHMRVSVIRSQRILFVLYSSIFRIIMTVFTYAHDIFFVTKLHGLSWQISCETLIFLKTPKALEAPSLREVTPFIKWTITFKKHLGTSFRATRHPRGGLVESASLLLIMISHLTP